MSIWKHKRLKDWPSWFVSLAVHLSILLTLWQTFVPSTQRDEVVGAIDGQLESDGGAVAFDRIEAAPENLAAPADEAPASVAGLMVDALAGRERAAAPEVSPPIVDGIRGGAAKQPKAEPAVASAGPGAAEPGGKPARAAKGKGGAAKEQMPDLGGNLEGRRPGERARLVKAGGGTRQSEEAVELGLDWLARHQQSDGSWSFQHGPDDPGTLDCPMGATGLALLAFLGAGYTHKDGPYQERVDRGLKFIMGHMELNESGGWMLGTGLATMYVQGICTTALCEALSMTKDPSLRRHAQLAVQFICKAQDPDGGGWRYRIPQAGDTSVVGWQLMALKSAKVTEITVPPRVITRVTKFLNSVDSEGGALYGYTNPNSVRPTTTAVGLLCRMYLGRDESHRGLIRGMRHLSQLGPDARDMYYNYYATQAMRHWGGSAWEAWNPVMRDLLVSTQSHSGDSAGSWVTDRSHGAEMGGRLYTTCLSIMTLEVYYRYLPLYKKRAVSDDF